MQALEAKETPQVMDFRRPVQCVALDPDYSKSSARRIVSGGMAGQLILNEKGENTLSVTNGRMAWKFRDDLTFRGGTNICYMLARTIHCLGQ